MARKHKLVTNLLMCSKLSEFWTLEIILTAWQTIQHKIKCRCTTFQSERVQTGTTVRGIALKSKVVSYTNTINQYDLTKHLWSLTIKTVTQHSKLQIQTTCFKMYLGYNWQFHLENKRYTKMTLVVLCSSNAFCEMSCLVTASTIWLYTARKEQQTSISCSPWKYHNTMKKPHNHT